MPPTGPFSLPFASYAWQCAQKPCDKRDHFSLGWAFNLFEDFQPGEIVAVDKRSNLKHCHAIVAQQIPQVGIPHDELRAALALQGQARLDTVEDRDPKNPTVSRVLLHFPGGLGSFSASRLTRVLPSSPQRVLLVNETITYRRLAKTQVGKADGVLEIGSSFGECTQILTKHARAVIGIDNSPELVEESRRRFPFCQIELLNCFERERLQFICTQLQEGTENFKIFVDIGGDRTSTAVCRILVLLDEVLGSSSPLLRAPCLVVVKSERLASAAAESCDTAGNICNLPEWWQSCVVPSSTRQQRKWGVNFTGHETCDYKSWWVYPVGLAHQFRCWLWVECVLSSRPPMQYAIDQWVKSWNLVKSALVFTVLKSRSFQCSKDPKSFLLQLICRRWSPDEELAHFHKQNQTDTSCFCIHTHLFTKI